MASMRAFTLSGALCAAFAGAAAASDHDRHGARAMRAPLPAEYRQECGSCHVPFPPSMLPAASWQTLMGGLATHFGTDAAVDARTTQAIASWLASEAATSGRAQVRPPEDRITRSAWFVHKHREVASDAWRRPAIQRASNCSACHPRAEQGDFDEHAVRIPR